MIIYMLCMYLTSQNFIKVQHVLLLSAIFANGKVVLFIKTGQFK